MLVGVHDPKGPITHQVEAHVGKDLLRLPFEPAIGHEPDGDALSDELDLQGSCGLPQRCRARSRRWLWPRSMRPAVAGSLSWLIVRRSITRFM